MAGPAKRDPLDISSHGLNESPGTPELNEYLASINSEVVTDSTPAIEDHKHWNSPRHQRGRPPHYKDSPLPFSPQKPHQRQLDYLSLSPHPTHYGSPKEQSNDIWRQAMLNKKNCLSDTYPDSPAPPNNSVEVGVAFLSHPPNDAVLNNTAELGNHPSTELSSSQCSGTSGQYRSACQPQPPNVEYSPQFDYKLNEDYSRLDVTGSPYNYNPSEMTFCKRKFNNSNGSDQSSLNRTPVTAIRHVAKRGKLEKEFWEGQSGKNAKMNKALADESLGSSSANASGHDFNKTWMPESEEKNGMDKTWMPNRSSSNSGDEFQDELESTDLKGRSLDKTWVPERPPSTNCDDSNTIYSPSVKCMFCCGTYINGREKFKHILEMHGVDAVNMMMPQICTNCPDKHESVAFCTNVECWDNPFLCNPCISAHKRVSLTKGHVVIFSASCSDQCDQHEEDPFLRLENILDSVWPRRANHSWAFSPQTKTKSDVPELGAQDPKIEEDLTMIRHQSLDFASLLNKVNEAQLAQFSDDGSNSSSSVASRSSSEKSSTTAKTLTGEIIADNLLTIFTAGPLVVKTKVAVVIEMLVKTDAIDPSLFCDKRSLSGFQSLLSTQETKFLVKALSSLDELITAVGKKGSFFGLVNLSKLSEMLEALQEPSRKFFCAQSNTFECFDPAFITNMASSILKKLSNLIESI